MLNTAILIGGLGLNPQVVLLTGFWVVEILDAAPGHLHGSSNVVGYLLVVPGTGLILFEGFIAEDEEKGFIALEEEKGFIGE